MTRTSLIFGPPGTGKTTTLLDEVDAALGQGISPERIGFFAFTRKAAGEAAGRAIDRFGLTDDELPWFRTLHSAAFRILGLQRGEVMQSEHFKEIGKALGGFTFTGDYDETTERPPQGGGLGDIALALYSRARARMIPIKDEWAKTDSEISLAEAQLFADTLDSYKKTYQLLDFNDFLDEVTEPLPLDLMIIDEAQDLTRQQWGFARRIGKQAERVIIAGDDDQAIHTWSGADLNMFLSFAAAVRVLPTSHRLPRVIWERARALAETIKYRQPKEWGPREDDSPGEISWLAYADEGNLQDGATWLLLCRHKHQVEMLTEICRQQGVVYQANGVWSNNTPAVRAVINYERMRRGDAVTGENAVVMSRYIVGMSKPSRSQAWVKWEDIHWPFEGRPDWMTALGAIGASEREYIRRLRRNGEPLTGPGRVVVSTIHGIKGGEADHVMVIPDVTRRVADQLHTDDEKRVWYVALTRAKQALFMCVPQTQNFFS